MRACDQTSPFIKESRIGDISPSPVNVGVSSYQNGTTPDGTVLTRFPAPRSSGSPIDACSRHQTELVLHERDERWPFRSDVARSPNPQLIPPPPMALGKRRYGGRPNMFDEDANQEGMTPSQNPDTTIHGSPSPLAEARFGVRSCHRPASAPTDKYGMTDLGSAGPAAPSRTTSPVILLSPPRKKLKFFDHCGNLVEHIDPACGRRDAVYKCGALLGSGGFAQVYAFRDVETDTVYACKIIEKSNLSRSGHAGVHQEIDIQRRMRHPNILQVVKFFSDMDYYYILFERCFHKNLMEISKARGRLSIEEVRHIMWQVCCGVDYLHRHNVIHRDIKLGNIMVDLSGNMKIGDFGFATELSFPNERKTRSCGTPNFIAPEVLACSKSKCSGYGLEADVWSLGVVLYVLAFGYAPFASKVISVTYGRILDGEYEIPHSSVPDSCVTLIQSILQRDPSMRPTARQILESNFLRGCDAGKPPRSLVPSLLPSANHASIRSITSPTPLKPTNLNDIPRTGPRGVPVARLHRGCPTVYRPPPDAVLRKAILCSKYGQVFATLQGESSLLVALFNDRTKMVRHEDGDGLFYYARELCHPGSDGDKGSQLQWSTYCDTQHRYHEVPGGQLKPDSVAGGQYLAAATKKSAIVKFLRPAIYHRKALADEKDCSLLLFDTDVQPLRTMCMVPALHVPKEVIYVKECKYGARDEMTFFAARMSNQSFQVHIETVTGGNQKYDSGVDFDGSYTWKIDLLIYAKMYALFSAVTETRVICECLDIRDFAVDQGGTLFFANSAHTSTVRDAVRVNTRVLRMIRDALREVRCTDDILCYLT